MVGGRKAEGGRKEGREGRGRERGEGGVQNKTNQGERKLKESSCWERERQSRQQAGRQAGDETNTRDALDTSPSSGGEGERKSPSSFTSQRQALERKKSDQCSTHRGGIRQPPAAHEE